MELFLDKCWTEVRKLSFETNISTIVYAVFPATNAIFKTRTQTHKKATRSVSEVIFIRSLLWQPFSSIIFQIQAKHTEISLTQIKYYNRCRYSKRVE